MNLAKKMKYLIRFRPLLSSSRYKQLSFFKLSGFRVAHLSSLSKSSKFSQSRKTQENPLKNVAEADNIASLFNEITEILGGDAVIPDKTPSGISIMKETHVRDTDTREAYDYCTEGARKNVEDGFLHQKVGTHLGNVGEVDVSPVVQKIAQIVRAENDKVSMVQRLEDAGFQFEPEIVEKVLKRCFKVPHSALRFFNWVKLRCQFCHTTETYNTMLYIAGEAKEFGLVEKLVKEMEENSCEKNIKTWTILISQYGKAKMIGKALLVFEKMRKCGCEPDATAYKMMIRSLCVAGTGDIALEFYKEMIEKEMALDFSMYKMLLNCIAGTENVATVHSVAGDMIRISQIPERDVYHCLLKSFCVSGKIRAALELIRELNNKELSLDPEYLEILVKGLCRADRNADALEIVDLMNRKHTVGAKVYGIIINGYLRRNDLPKALDLFQTMKESGHLPTASTYTELMQHLFRLNEYQKACELYNEMIEKGIELDSVAITAVVAGHVCQNQIAEAWKLFKSMEDKGIRPTWKSYSIFIKELCKVSRTDEIVNVLNEMQASKINIGDEIFHWVISCMEKMGEKDKIEKVKQIKSKCDFYLQGVEVFNDDASDSIRQEKSHTDPQELKQGDLVVPPSTAYSKEDVQEICNILWSSTDWNNIQEALKTCSVQFTPELVVAILSKCVIHGNMALHFFYWVDKQAGYRHTTETYNMAIKIAGCGKDFKQMRNLFFEMRRRGCLITPDTWAIMIMRYGRTGLTDIALRTYKEMKAAKWNPTGSTYKCLITVLCGRKGRKVDEAVKIFQEMIGAGHIPDKELLESYLGCLCEVGNLLEARSCVDSLHKVGFTVPLAYSMYIRALCRARRLEEALALVDEVGTERHKLDQYTYGSLVHGLLQRRQLEEALAKVDSLKQIGINPTVHVYTSLIVHYFKENQTGKALETFKKMQQEGCQPTIVTYSALIRGYMNVGKVDDAWDVFHTMKAKGPLPDFRTYSMFISCLCRAGKSEDALKLLSEMLDTGIVPSTVNFRTVFYGLNREGKQNLAQIVLQQKSALMNKRKLLI